MHSLHKVNELQRMDGKKSTSEKRLSVPIYPDLEVINDEEIKTVEEENNLLSGDLERLNGRVPTVSDFSMTISFYMSIFSFFEQKNLEFISL